MTAIGLRHNPKDTARMRREGLIALPEDLGIRRTDATRELLAAKSVADLVEWSGGLYNPPATRAGNARIQPASENPDPVERLADLAVDALIDEADLSPKPALVDRRGSGAHTDLHLGLMHASALALWPAFKEKWLRSPSRDRRDRFAAA